MEYIISYIVCHMDKYHKNAIVPIKKENETGTQPIFERGCGDGGENKRTRQDHSKPVRR